MRLLLIEDDHMIGESMVDLLRGAGYTVDWVKEVGAANAALDALTFNLVLLDLGLHGRDGMEVLTALRARQAPTPVLIVSARDTVNSRVAGLDAGADDYLLKPFAPEELMARIRAMLRRACGHPELEYSWRNVTIRSASRAVLVEGSQVILSAREWAVLDPLLARPGTPLSRAQLEETLYGCEGEINSNAVEVFIHGLRRKLGVELIQNVRGVGYMVPKEGRS